MARKGSRATAFGQSSAQAAHSIEIPATMYLVEPAKSNRALCKQCKVKIDKGLLRIGTVTPGPGDYDITSWRHLECQKMPKGLDLANLTGFDALTPEDQATVTAWHTMGGAKAPGKSAAAPSPADGGSSGTAGGSGGTDLTGVEIKKMKPAELKAALAAYGLDAGGKKKAEQVELLSEVQKRQVTEAKYSSLSGALLKDMLRLNTQKVSGTKDELVERCVDCFMYGCLPRCPDCGAARLRVHYPSSFGHGGQGRFGCPGYYDDDVYVRCGYDNKGAAVDRPAWIETDAAASKSAPPPKKSSAPSGGSGKSKKAPAAAAASAAAAAGGGSSKDNDADDPDYVAAAKAPPKSKKAKKAKAPRSPDENEDPDYGAAPKSKRQKKSKAAAPPPPPPAVLEMPKVKMPGADD